MNDRDGLRWSFMVHMYVRCDDVEVANDIEGGDSHELLVFATLKRLKCLCTCCPQQTP